MEEDFKIELLSERGIRDFCVEFVKLTSTDTLGPLNGRLAERMNNGGLCRVETCLPNDMHGKVLQECLDYVDYVWTNDYKGIKGPRQIRYGMGVEVMDLSWNLVAQRWLLRTAAEYLTPSCRRLCIVLDMYSPSKVVLDYPDIYDYFKPGLNEGYLILPGETAYSHYCSCLQRGLGMSYGCFVTLPEGLTRNDLMSSEGLLTADKGIMLADSADAVYLGAYDGLGYMIGWFPER